MCFNENVNITIILPDTNTKVYNIYMPLNMVAQIEFSMGCFWFEQKFINDYTVLDWFDWLILFT